MKKIEGAEPMATMNSLTDIWSVVMDSLSQELTRRRQYLVFRLYPH